MSAGQGWTLEANGATPGFGGSGVEVEHVTMDFVTHLPRTS